MYESPTIEPVGGSSEVVPMATLAAVVYAVAVGAGGVVVVVAGAGAGAGAVVGYAVAAVECGDYW